MKYILSEKYNTPELQSKIMGPNPVKLEEELLTNHKIPKGSIVCDLGSGQGLTGVFLAKEYGFTVYAADLWSDPGENRSFFDEMGLSREQIIPVKADAEDLPFEKNFLMPLSAPIHIIISVEMSIILTTNYCPLLKAADIFILQSPV